MASLRAEGELNEKFTEEGEEASSENIDEAPDPQKTDVAAEDEEEFDVEEGLENLMAMMDKAID
jgi:hypothetical protein